MSSSLTGMVAHPLVTIRILISLTDRVHGSEAIPTEVRMFSMKLTRGSRVTQG